MLVFVLTLWLSLRRNSTWLFRSLSKQFQFSFFLLALFMPVFVFRNHLNRNRLNRSHHNRNRHTRDRHSRNRHWHFLTGIPSVPSALQAGTVVIVFGSLGRYFDDVLGSLGQCFDDALGFIGQYYLVHLHSRRTFVICAIPLTYFPPFLTKDPWAYLPGEHERFRRFQ